MSTQSELKSLIEGGVELIKIGAVILMVVAAAAVTFKIGRFIWTGIVG